MKKSYNECMFYDPSLGTNVFVVDQRTGKQTPITVSFFSFSLSKDDFGVIINCQKWLLLLKLFEISNSWRSLWTFLEKKLFQYKASSFFTFHHANAFEKDGNLVVDYCRYDKQEMDNVQIKNLWNSRMRKPDIFQAFSLESMRKGNFLNTDVSLIFRHYFCPLSNIF